MHSLILLNVFQTSDKNIHIDEKQAVVFLPQDPLLSIDQDNKDGLKRRLPAIPASPSHFFTALSLSRRYFVKYLSSVLFFVHKHLMAHLYSPWGSVSWLSGDSVFNVMLNVAKLFWVFMQHNDCSYLFVFHSFSSVTMTHFLRHNLNQWYKSGIKN